MTASVFLTVWSCGVDQVSGTGSPDVKEADDESRGSGGNVTGASGGQLPEASGGRPPEACGGSGDAGAPAAPEEPLPVHFFACETEENRVEVRGVRGMSCWLVMLERAIAPDRCHEEPESSKGYCVVAVRYSPDDPSCASESREGANEYIATGAVQVKEGPVIDLELSFSLPFEEWTSDVPFAVSNCRPHCGERDCRE
ncbi:MAG: hypothetical protein B6A08_00125 [Sorangiineae bacterium NIC37A_2]|jgi:hypothetical protein|nr:MAG: hypothetical protein B6A08_00125 [Sorangiineae bacterium NIC37A_2]